MSNMFLKCSWHVLDMFLTCSSLVIFSYWTRNSLNNLLSYCGLIDKEISTSDKDLPVSTSKSLVWPSLACLVARGARAEALDATECLWKSFKSADTEWCWLNRLLPVLVLFLSWPGTVLMLESPKNNKVGWCTLYNPFLLSYPF